MGWGRWSSGFFLHAFGSQLVLCLFVSVWVAAGLLVFVLYVVGSPLVLCFFGWCVFLVYADPDGSLG